MAENRVLADLSDDELIALLKVREGERDWALRELIEVERRGMDFLAKEPSLQAGITAVLDELQKKIKKIMEPAFESFKLQADFARDLSKQLQGFGQQLNLQFGNNALVSLQKQSDAYRNIIEKSSLGINSQLVKRIVENSNLAAMSQMAKNFAQQTAPYQGLLEASKLAIAANWARPIIGSQPAVNADWVSSRVQESVQQQAKVYKEFSENLTHAGVEIQNKLNNEYLQETSETITLDLPINDPIVTTSVAENMLRKMTTSAEVLEFIGVNKIRTSGAGGDQPPGDQKELATGGDAPKRNSYYVYLLLAALATESYFLFFRR